MENITYKILGYFKLKFWIDRAKRTNESGSERMYYNDRGPLSHFQKHSDIYQPKYLLNAKYASGICN